MRIGGCICTPSASDRSYMSVILGRLNVRRIVRKRSGDEKGGGGPEVGVVVFIADDDDCVCFLI